MEWKKPILKKINKYYGASFECSDFESLYKLVDEALTSAYERGGRDREKKIVNVLEYYEAGTYDSEYCQIVEDLIKKIKEKV